MIHEIIKPTSKKLIYNLPSEYLNKEIEIIILPFYELKPKKTRQRHKKGFIETLTSNPKVMKENLVFFTRDEANER